MGNALENTERRGDAARQYAQSIIDCDAAFSLFKKAA